jgi:UDP-N-acetylmuramoyl-tripeptide--D-alanyl-D-alanine ligase
MRFTREEIARAVGGRLSGQDGFVVGVSTDSRSIGVGSLFVPIVAERDGHDFIDGALDRGAAAFLTHHHDEREGAIEVADTLEALRLLGGAARSRIPGPVIGITGSSGKTSTKAMHRTMPTGPSSRWGRAGSGTLPSCVPWRDRRSV